MRKALLILGSALVLFSTSCKKDDSGPSVTVQTVAGNYKLAKMAVKTGNTPETEFPIGDYLDDCQKDDIVSLNSNMSYVEVDAGVSCGDGNYESDWSLTNSTTIVLDGYTYTIRKFDGKNLELVLNTNLSGVAASIVFFYVKQ